MEIWKPIPGSTYEASSLGRIRSPRGYVLKPYNHVLGYLLVGVNIDGVAKTRTVHSIVALAFHGPRPAGLDIAHGDNDKQNNRPENLRYATRVENMRDSYRQAHFGAEVYPWRLMDVGCQFEMPASYQRKNLTWRCAERGRRFDRSFTFAANDNGSWTVTRVA